MPTTPFAGAADRVATLPRTIVERGAERFDEIARDTASRAVGGTMQLHGRGGKRRTVKLKTYTKMVGEGSTARAFVRPSPAGVWRWLEDGTRPHQIGARRARTGQSRRTATFLLGAGYAHPIRAPIAHPGSRGKQTWTKAVATFRAEAVSFVARDLRKAVRG